MSQFFARGLIHNLTRHKLYSLWIVLVVGCYATVFVSPALFWPAAFLSDSIPVLLLINLIILGWFLIRRDQRVIFPLIGVLLGIPFLMITYHHRFNDYQLHDGISVLSFNAKLFRKENTYNEFSPQLIQWVVNDPSNIKCIQEFSTNNHWAGLDVAGQLNAKGYDSFAYSSPMPANQHSRGIAIFSRFKILDRGIIWEDSTSVNGAIFVDVQVASDTLRIYNIHLASMNLQLSDYRSLSNYGEKIFHFIRRLKDSSGKRATQMKKILDHIRGCHYPVLLCGDFNETPYSYNYFKARSLLTNSFEEAGNGFGFSFNNILFFLRIDHQFFSHRLSAVQYDVDRSMTISDHFPTKGRYFLRSRGYR